MGWKTSEVVGISHGAGRVSHPGDVNMRAWRRAYRGVLLWGHSVRQSTTIGPWLWLAVCSEL